MKNILTKLKDDSDKFIENEMKEFQFLLRIGDNDDFVIILEDLGNLTKDYNIKKILIKSEDLFDKYMLNILKKFHDIILLLTGIEPKFVHTTYDIDEKDMGVSIVVDPCNEEILVIE